MSCFSRTLLAASISAALFVPQTQAEAMLDNSVQEMPAIDQCLINEPEAENSSQQPINVEADTLEAVNGERANYSGNVVVVQGKKRILADTVTLHQKDNIVVAQGNVNFSDGEVRTISDKATNNLNTDLMTLENTKYQFLCEPGRGEAVYISKTGKAVYEIEDGSITSCPEGNNAWRLKASSIDIDQNEEQATFYNPRFEIQNIPIFYLPFLTVPIGDTRKTGFLYPTVSYGSSNGFEAQVPIYWNLAPNYDLETTFKYMQERGTQLNSEFRYLNDFGTGNIKSEYLPDDQKYPEKGSRWGFQYQHSGIFNQAWKFEIDYSQVSDISYFSDLDSGIGNREDGQLIQEGKATYRTHNWDSSILVRDFQLLTEDKTSTNQPYRLMPQIAFNYYAPELLPYLNFDMVSHLSRFETDARGKPAATRAHIEPGFTIPLSNTWGTWTTEARVLGTYYQQDLNGVDLNSDNYKDLKESVSRIIPEFRTHAGLVLERDTVLFDDYTQTLEPQIQYLYVPREDQRNIGLYDTTLLQTDYYGLFRSRKYSGVDYIAPANQISYGASSRFFDDQYKERLNISFGQIFYLKKNLKNSSPNETENLDTNSNYSAWAVEMDFNYDDLLFYHGGVQYDIDSSTMQLANSTLEYRVGSGYIQTNYRYVTKEYIDNTVGDTITNINAITKDGISQAGLLAGYQISKKWNASGQYFYDLTTEKSLEWLANLSYTSDCWYIGFTYSNQLRKWDGDFVTDPNATPLYENNFSLNFGIVGFGTTIGAGSGMTGVDSAGNSLSYGRPFFLNN
ncbi:LPS assembly protein LptD [Vibrio anguillarum]|uniref:LPS assembly protein LptD n=1 Tax=Vibrio anguillarum TaxID=55601 RepID=UPI00097E3F84|nr:LPS assembly protein LptD [Vibrio anguillarum]MBF4281511.1 LPS assembly protein LptD [Vibrio anguillarum]MBF4287524.1 LPS assembly protein LptD [Vibrio anguillarum]MBF4339539.1 LPS assembly protein LptD [Vibrio anguillarum]MBF4356162.1 LPS assembly protein LptD [Vibrio anguillarum]MBF4378690.1 LPS assembly protein LptD [Vibrio anguillarum]